MSDKTTGQFQELDALQTVIGLLVSDELNNTKNLRPSDETVQEVVATLIQDPTLADKILSAIFPSGITATKSFYNQIAELEFKLGYSKNVHKLGGVIWARAFSTLPTPTNFTLLECLNEKGMHSFFFGLAALPYLLDQIHLPADFITQWLLSIKKRLGTDGASRGFWEALQRLVKTSPLIAFEVTKRISNISDEDSAAIAANLLGYQRAIDPITLELHEFVLSLKHHQHLDRRVIYHRSWSILGLQRTLSDSEFSDAIEQMSLGMKEEVEEAFNMIRVLLPLDSTSDASFIFALRWLHERTSSSVSDFWKHFIIQMALQTYSRWQDLEKVESLPTWIDLVLGAFPIRENHSGTWSELDSLLAFLIEKDPKAFHKLLLGLARKDSKGLSIALSDREIFHRLIRAMNASKAVELVAETLLSSDDSIRHLGFTLFRVLDLKSLDNPMLLTASDDQIAVIIFGFQLEPFYDEVTVRFLLALEPRIRVGSKGLQGFFVNELCYQSKNMPGMCLEILKENTDASSLIKEAVDKTESYFTALRACFKSGINSIGIPGLERARRVRSSLQSKKIGAQMKEASVFTKFLSTSYTLYGGKKWQTFTEGKLGEISEMQQISHSAEMPRMPGIDPEGIAIRRYIASRNIRDFFSTINTR